MIDKILNDIRKLDVILTDEEQTILISYYKEKKFSSLNDMIIAFVINEGKTFDRTNWTAFLTDKINYEKINTTIIIDEDIIKYCKGLILYLFTQILPYRTNYDNF